MTPEKLAEAREFEHCREYEHCKADSIIDMLLEYIDSQDKEIKRLEDALVEERAGQVTAVRLVRQLDAVWITEEKTDEDRQIAREQLRAEKVIR